MHIAIDHDLLRISWTCQHKIIKSTSKFSTPSSRMGLLFWQLTTDNWQSGKIYHQRSDITISRISEVDGEEGNKRTEKRRSLIEKRFHHKNITFTYFASSTVNITTIFKMWKNNAETRILPSRPFSVVVSVVLPLLWVYPSRDLLYPCPILRICAFSA